MQITVTSLRRGHTVLLNNKSFVVEHIAPCANNCYSIKYSGITKPFIVPHTTTVTLAN